VLAGEIRVGAILTQIPFPSLEYPVEQWNSLASKMQTPYPSE
jgi:hypothetical protein